MSAADNIDPDDFLLPRKRTLLRCYCYRNGAQKCKVCLKRIKEGDIRGTLKKRVEAYGGEIRAVSWLGRSNAPDVLCLFPAYSAVSLRRCRDIWEGPKDTPQGWSFWVETKRPGKDATEAQAREHERMRAAGCEVLVITNEQELDAWLPPL